MKDTNQMSHEILFRERYGVLGQETVYAKPSDQNVMIQLGSANNLPKTVYRKVISTFRQVFLPQGFPESVSADYVDYQVWDTIQAFCSTISGALTTQAIMKSVGVGDNVATPYGAAVMWILKDGTGMMGRIVFAWWKGTFLDADCKKWRLGADFLNDIAMGIELFLPYFPVYSTQILCFSTTLKAIVGVAGGATRAAITQHQAIRENMADVSAKDGSQETFVNLTASVIGILILSLCTKDGYVWSFFIAFTLLHLYANYRAVKSLRLVTLNPGRLIILLQTYMTKETISSPEVVNKQESVLLGVGLTDIDICGHQIELGISLNKVLSTNVISAEDMNLLANLYKRRKHLLIVDNENKKIYVALQQKVFPIDVLEAYFHAVLLGIGTVLSSGSAPKALSVKRVKNACPLNRLETLLMKCSTGPEKRKLRIPLEAVMATESILLQEFSEFSQSLQAKGWSIRNHHLPVDEWRCKWTAFDHESQKEHKLL